jgi:hypoxanthine phosphoribosyltransferase
MQNLKELTFETNGTQELSDEFFKYLNEWTYGQRSYDDLTFSISPKLSISGEKWEDAIKPDVVAQYSSIGYAYVKFVVATKEDVAEAEQAVDEYQAKGFDGPVYIMPCGGTEEGYYLNNRQVAELAMEKGWRYSDRLQIPLFNNYEDDFCTVVYAIEKSNIRYDLVVGIQRGGLIPAVHISNSLDIPFASLNWSHGPGKVRDSSNPHLKAALTSGRNVLVVDDICDTGITLDEVSIAYPGIHTAVLVYNEENKKGFVPTYYGWKIKRTEMPEWLDFWWEKK